MRTIHHRAQSIIPRSYLQLEMEFLEESLDKLYDRKNEIMRNLRLNEMGQWNPELNDEFDTLTRKEASMISKLEDLQLSMEADRISDSKDQSIHATMGSEKTEEEKALEEIQCIREGKEAGRNPFRFPGISKEEFDKLTLEEIAGYKEEQIDAELEAMKQVEHDALEKRTLDDLKEIREQIDERDSKELDI